MKDKQKLKLKCKDIKLQWKSTSACLQKTREEQEQLQAFLEKQSNIISRLEAESANNKQLYQMLKIESSSEVEIATAKLRIMESELNANTEKVQKI